MNNKSKFKIKPRIRVPALDVKVQLGFWSPVRVRHEVQSRLGLGLVDRD